MKFIKKFLVGIAYICSVTVAPLAIAGTAHAIQLDQVSNPLQCQIPDGEFTERGITEGCDLGVDKQVSINGGAFVEANTSAAAVQAQVDDTVTWKIIVTNTSADASMVPYGQVTVHDVLPGGAAFDSYTASSGTYVSNDWTFSLFGNLSATLTIVSHAVATGLFQNTAALSAYDPCLDGCLGAGAYSDSDSSNNSNDAWIDPSAKPVVLAASTELTNTGSGTTASFIAAGLIILTISTLVVGRSRRYELNR